MVVRQWEIPDTELCRMVSPESFLERIGVDRAFEVARYFDPIRLVTVIKQPRPDLDPSSLTRPEKEALAEVGDEEYTPNLSGAAPGGKWRCACDVPLLVAQGAAYPDFGMAKTTDCEIVDVRGHTPMHEVIWLRAAPCPKCMTVYWTRMVR